MIQLQRQEEEAKAKASAAHEQYKLQLARTNDVRQYYFSHTLPSILKVKGVILEVGRQRTIVEDGTEL
jgi:hypothetical protein